MKLKLLLVLLGCFVVVSVVDAKSDRRRAREGVDLATSIVNLVGASLDLLNPNPRPVVVAPAPVVVAPPPRPVIVTPPPPPPRRPVVIPGRRTPPPPVRHHDNRGRHGGRGGRR